MAFHPAAINLPNTKCLQKKQKGYSIVELSIALAIISIILVTALAGVQRILRSNNVNEDLRNLNLLASKITVMLTNVTNTAGITQANLVNLRAFEGFRVAGTRWNADTFESYCKYGIWWVNATQNEENLLSNWVSFKVLPYAP